MTARTADHEARVQAKAQREAQAKAEADAVWKQVRAEEKSILDRTQRLKALRLAKEAEARKHAVPENGSGSGMRLVARGRSGRARKSLGT